MTVEKIAAISQLVADGLLEKADTMAITYMASMSITPAMAKGRFHFMGTPRFLWDGSFLYYNRKLRKLKERIREQIETLEPAVLKTVTELGFIHKIFRFATCTFLPDYSTIRGK